MNDYLWDRSGPPDPEIAKLEALLGRFKLEERNFELPASESVAAAFRRPARFSAQRWALAGAAAVLALFVVGSLYVNAHRAWRLTSVEGTVRIDQEIAQVGNRMHERQTLETGPTSRVTLAADGIGQVELGPDTRVTLLEDSRSREHLRLAYGSLHADIIAPPYVFLVLTPSAYALDMGCSYTLVVHRDGSGRIEVTAGWVEFQHGDNQVMVPAGAISETRPGLGPGAPYFADASPTFRNALEVINFDRGYPTKRSAALSELLSVARKNDAFTLLNLFRRVDPAERGPLYDRLAQLLPPPAGIKRQAVVAGDWSVLEPWWDELGLGSPKKGKKRPPIIHE